MKWLLARLKEKSTWLGIFTLAGLVGMKIEPELRDLIINCILSVAAVAAFVFQEDAIKHDQTPSIDMDDCFAGLPTEHIDEKTVVLPPIELQGRADSPAPDSALPPPPVGFQRYRDRDDDGMQPELPTRSESQQSNGWNG